MPNGNVLSGIPSLVGTTGTILLSGVVIKKIARVSKIRSLKRKKLRMPRRLSKLTNI